MSTEKLIHDIPFIVAAARRQQDNVRGLTYNFVIASPLEKPKSLLDRLSADQQRALHIWTKEQVPSNGIIDMMKWPGWAETLRQSVEEI